MRGILTTSFVYLSLLGTTSAEPWGQALAFPGSLFVSRPRTQPQTSRTPLQFYQQSKQKTDNGPLSISKSENHRIAECINFVTPTVRMHCRAFFLLTFLQKENKSTSRGLLWHCFWILHVYEFMKKSFIRVQELQAIPADLGQKKCVYALHRMPDNHKAHIDTQARTGATTSELWGWYAVPPKCVSMHLSVHFRDAFKPL